MFQIDKNMYDTMKEWSDNRGDYKADIMYINSCNRELADLTVRKYMHYLYEEDYDFCDLYFSVYSAKSFYRNMRDYFLKVNRMWMNKTDKNASLMKIIDDIPSRSCWIILFVEDIDYISDDKEKDELMQVLLAFASKGAEIVLVGTDDPKDIFTQYDCDLCELFEKFEEDEENERLMIGVYNQEITPCLECFTADSLDEERDELIYYWDLLYEQLEKGGFNYNSYKALFKETVDFIIPRVSKDQVYCCDIGLFEKISLMYEKMWREKKKEYDGFEPRQLDGCRLWEFEAAYQFAHGLNIAIINRLDDDAIKDGIVTILVYVEKHRVDNGYISITGTAGNYIDINGDNVIDEMDRLSNVIFECTYNGNEEALRKYVLDEDDK